MYVKICGLQTPSTLCASLEAGADAVGFIFAPGSARTVPPEQVKELIATVPASVETVGVFRNQPLNDVLAMAAKAGVSTVQLHGDEPLTNILELEKHGFRTLRAFSAANYAALRTAELQQWSRHRIMLDAVDPGAGQTFDPSILRTTPQGFWLLAGGLTTANVSDLVQTFQPSGVDVSSGVESRRGVKSIELIKDFITAARASQPPPMASLPSN